jgi:hypothetical protein
MASNLNEIIQRLAIAILAHKSKYAASENTKKASYIWTYVSKDLKDVPMKSKNPARDFC